MKKFKEILNKIFIDGLSGMALGLFSTLIVGTILAQIADMIPGTVGTYLLFISKAASLLTGAGIGCGVAYKFKESPLVVVSASVAGLVGAYASQIIAGTFITEGLLTIKAPGEPLGAFVAAYIAITLGHLVSGKTKVDILVTPIVSILSGSFIGLIVGPYISDFMKAIGSVINWGVELHPFTMGIVVSVIMGIALTLPISSAAIAISLNLSGIAAGAAVAGCCANMIGFAVASYRENKMGGLLSQGVGTSMLQIPNIVKKPSIWLPAIFASAITGPVSALIGMTNTAQGAGMGTCGFVGQIMGYQAMAPEFGAVNSLLLMLGVHFILPALLALGCSELMRKHGMIKAGDMALSN